MALAHALGVSLAVAHKLARLAGAASVSLAYGDDADGRRRNGEEGSGLPSTYLSNPLSLSLFGAAASSSLKMLHMVLLSIVVASANAQLRIRALYQSSQLTVHSLYIRGDALGLNWTRGVPMRKSASGLEWTVELASPAAPLVFEFKVLVDDEQWQLGGNEAAQVTSAPAVLTIAPWFVQPVGAFAVLFQDVPAPAFQNTRDVVVYVPAPYLENTHPEARWETLLMHDGQNVFNDSTSFAGVSWRAADTLDSVIGAGTVRPIVVLAPYNTAARIDEYTPVADPEYGGGRGDAYLDWLRDMLLPLAASSLRIGTSRAQLGLLGSSLGGLISCYACWTRPEYGRCGCMSSSMWWDNEWFNDLVAATPAAAPDTRLYLDSGDQPAPNGDDELQTQRVVTSMRNRGMPHVSYFLAPGGSHDEQSWGARFDVPLKALYTPNDV